MTIVERIPANPRSLSVARATAQSRDGVVDAMRGIAILMVIGIHSLPQPLDAAWAKSLDAALRPCVPVFLFVSGYLTALSGRVPLAKAVKGGFDSVCDRVRRRLCLHGAAQSGDGPSHRHGVRPVRSGICLRLLLRLRLRLLHARVYGSSLRLAAPVPDSRQRHRSSADPLDRLRFACRRLSRPCHVQARRLGRIARRSPHARHSVLVLVCRARRADRDVRRPQRPGHAPRAACRHAGGLHGLCRRAHSRPWRRRHLRFDRLLSLRSPVLRLRCSRSSRVRRCLAGSARAATSSISGTSSSSWRCAITPRCVSSAVSPALPFAAA